MNQAKFADLVGVTPQRVSQWIKAGMPSAWHGGRGKGTYIDPKHAIAWLNERGYAMNPDSRRDGNTFPEMESVCADLKEIAAGERESTIRDAIDGIWLCLDDAADEVALWFEFDTPTAWDIAATVLVFAHRAACEKAEIDTGLPDEVETQLQAGPPSDSST